LLFGWTVLTVFMGTLLYIFDWDVVYNASHVSTVRNLPSYKVGVADLEVGISLSPMLWSVTPHFRMKFQEFPTACVN
jgi:hypothetical protein